MSDLIKDNVVIYKGLQKTFQQMNSGTQNAYLKILHAQEHFFINHPELQPIFVEESKELLVATLRKFEYAVMVGEQMHSIRELRSLRVNPYLKDGYSIPPESQSEFPFLDELLFDQALFQWRSFLDFYMKYLVYFCTNKYEVNMNVGLFNRDLDNAEENSKSKKVHDYFQANVINEESQNCLWGNTLRCYRDKTAHNKLITLTITGVKTRTGQVVLEPTTHGQEISYFVQETFENRAFKMLTELMPILYDVEWVTGPFRENLYT